MFFENIDADEAGPVIFRENLDKHHKMAYYV
jgi:hypothetical protein